MGAITRSRPGRPVKWTPYFFLLPYLVFFLLFRLGPTLAGILTGFTKWSIIGSPQWIGLKNYEALLKDPLFWTALKNTSYFLLLAAPVMVLLSFFLALLLNQSLRGRAIVRTVVFAPYVVMSTVVGVIWNWMYDTNYGLVNEWLRQFGIDKVPWLTSESTALPAIVITTVWWLVGYNTVLFLAGLQDVPEELYEAARIDGASFFGQLWHITRPLLTPTTFVVVMLTLINTFQVFDQVYVMTNGGPGTSTLTLVQYMYISAFQHFNMGYGSAVAVVVFLVLLVFAIIQSRLLKKEVG
jgi:multiple sugar transport system permease protein